ncbi:MAG: adenylate/guanylate cyclase domain-containing protein [Alphaproteobacteria bacterium]
MAPNEDDPEIDAAFRTAELRGLQAATVARIAALGVTSVWALLSTTGMVTVFVIGIMLLVALNGFAHYALRRRSRAPIIAYVTVLIDVALMGAAMFGWTKFGSPYLPPQMALRDGLSVYFYIVIALTAFSYAPALTLWAGVCSAAAWVAGGVWLAGLPDTLIVTDDLLPDVAAYLSVRLDPFYVDLYRVGQDAVILLVVAAIMTVAVARSRLLVIRQAAAARDRASLARYFAPGTVARLTGGQQMLHDYGASRVAVLFADVVGFTRMTEGASPTTVIALLRGLHARLETVVFEHEGTLDKFLGDGVMATFGTPEPGPRDAANAIAAGRAMLETVEAWNVERALAGEPPVRLSVGIHYGDAVLGNIGSDRRLEFAVLGDVVNVASRLETMTRELGCSLAASDEAVSAARGQAGEAIVAGLLPIGPRRLYGRVSMVDIWVERCDEGSPALVAAISARQPAATEAPALAGVSGSPP